MPARELTAEILRTSVSKPRGEILLAGVWGRDSLKGARLLLLRLEEIAGRELSEDDNENLQSIEDVDRFLKAFWANVGAPDDQWVVVSRAGDTLGRALVSHLACYRQHAVFLSDELMRRTFLLIGSLRRLR